MGNHEAPFEITPDLLANHYKRFANYIIDVLTIYLSVFPIAILLGLVAALSGAEKELTQWITGMNELQQFLFGALIVISYYGLFESLTQRTVGKYITGTKVIMIDGTIPDAKSGFLRAFCRLIPFEQFSFLGAIPRGFHDILTQTAVIDIKKYEAALLEKRSFNETEEQA